MIIMLAITLLLLQESGFYSWLADNHDADGWEETAQSWLISGVVLAAICAGLILFYKWLKKRSAKTVGTKIWSRGQSVVLMLVGLAPVLLMMLTLWYATHDYYDVVGIGGLMKGILLGWLVYLLFIFSAHVLSPWRKEIL